MAAAFVKGTGNVSVDGGNSVSFVFGSAPAATTNTIIGEVSTTQVLDASKFSDNQSGTYVIDHSGNDGGVITVYVFRRTTALSTGSTVTVTISGGSSDFYSGCANEYSGVSTGNIITGTSGSGTTSPFTAALLSALNVGDLGISVATADDNTATQGISDPPTGGTATWNTRAAKQTTNTSASIVAADIISAGGVESAITSCNTTTGRVGIIVGYKSAAAQAAGNPDENPRRNRPGRGPHSTGRYFRSQASPHVVTSVSIKDISPTGIVTAEVFGTAVLTQPFQTISPTGLASAEVFGSHTVANVAAQSITPTGLATAEAFGSHTVANVAAQTIAPTGIASAEAIGTLTIANVAAQIIAPAGISSAEAIGAMVIADVQLDISPAGIASAEAIGDLVIATSSTQTISVTGIATAEAFGTLALANVAAQVITIAAITSAEAFGSHIVANGVLTISPAGIPTAVVFGVPSVDGGAAPPSTGHLFISLWTKVV